MIGRPTGTGAGVRIAAALLLFISLIASCRTRPPAGRPAISPWTEVADLKRIPQSVTPPAERAAQKLALAAPCRDRLLADFRERYFRPWTAEAPLLDPAQTRQLMQDVAASRWYGENRRRVERHILDAILRDCVLEGFPSRNDRAIAVSPAHLRGLPT